MDPLIDGMCEKAMLEYICKQKAIRYVDLDTVWDNFRRNYPVPDEVSVSDLKLHFICLDKSSNKWDLDEEKFLYVKFGAWAEEVDQNALEFVEEDSVPGTASKLLVTFNRKQNLQQGISWDLFQLYRKTFELNEVNP